MPGKTIAKLGNKKISFGITFVFILMGILASSLLTYYYLSGNPAKLVQSDAASPHQETKAGNDCVENRVALTGYKLVKPLLYSEKECESESLSPLKGEIGNFIEQQKQAGNISNASVYLKMLSSEEWTSINPNGSYYPGSLIKLPMLIAFLRMEEAKPGFLSQKVTYTAGATVNIKQTFETKSIEPGKSYTIKELLEYMIAYSDNNATQLLNSYMKVDAINAVFKDIGLTPPPTTSAEYFNYKMTAKDYSKFMIAIYNSTYLSNSASEYAAELLSRCDFKDGLLKELPSNIKVAHKFGEAGRGNELELHESGIIFINDKPYQITVMTHGGDIKKQAAIISQISKMVYDRFNVPAV